MGNLNGKNVFRILHACRLYHYNFHLPGVSCPALVAPANGNLNPSSCTTSGNVFEGKCHYSCQSGYQISGVQVKNCLNTGQWDSQEEPTCQIRKPAITNVSLVGLKWSHGNWEIFLHLENIIWVTETGNHKQK